MLVELGIKYEPPRELKRGLDLLIEHGLLKILDDIVWRLTDKNIYAFMLEFGRITEEDRAKLYMDGEDMHILDLSKGDISEIIPYLIDRVLIMWGYNKEINIVMYMESIIPHPIIRDQVLDEYFYKWERRKERWKY